MHLASAACPILKHVTRHNGAATDQHCLEQRRSALTYCKHGHMPRACADAQDTMRAMRPI